MIIRVSTKMLESRMETLLWARNIVLIWGITKPFQQNEVPCYACKEFRALKSKCYFQSCILFEYRARNFIFWKGLVIPQIKTMLRPLSDVSNLDSNILDRAPIVGIGISMFENSLQSIQFWIRHQLIFRHIRVPFGHIPFGFSCVR